MTKLTNTKVYMALDGIAANTLFGRNGDACGVSDSTVGFGVARLL